MSVVKVWTLWDVKFHTKYCVICWAMDTRATGFVIC